MIPTRFSLISWRFERVFGFSALLYHRLFRHNEVVLFNDKSFSSLYICTIVNTLVASPAYTIISDAIAQVW